LLTVVSTTAPIAWSPSKLVFLVLAVIGGAMTELALQLAISALTFRTLATQALRGTVDAIFNSFGGYPIKIFPGVTQIVLTFVLPLAFVAYLPSTVLLDRGGELRVPGWLAMGAPVFGCLLCCSACAFWGRQIRSYQSSGN
jgi:ABC-2 type transport system permease protein